MEGPDIPPPPGYTSDAPSDSGERASFGRRFVQYVIDAIIIGVPSAAIGALLTSNPNGRSGVGVLILLAYFTYLEGSSSQTIGMRVMGLKVVDIRTGGPIDYTRAFVRSLGRLLATIPCLLGYLWVAWDKEKQGWHDKIATTYVVRA
jgi:uncharacterized RDD family membrane protein YckC